MGSVCRRSGWRVLLRVLPLLSLLQPLPGVSSKEGKFTSTNILAAPLTFAATQLPNSPPTLMPCVPKGEAWDK